MKKSSIRLLLINDYDLAYLVLHGGNGENGKIQAVLDILGKNILVQVFLLVQ